MSDEITHREDEDDQDLLTYGEASARLTEEIAKERARLATVPDDPAAQERIRARIAALQEALERHSAARELGNADFFGR